ncbi:MAG: tetratricopeptide repeat protein [Anaerolinea sp.]|nr:tetratricopeptide repeat protein [Anaerolinea sp.]
MSHDQIEQAIATLERQRAQLGDEVVNLAVMALRSQLADPSTTAPLLQQRKQVTILFADMSGYTALAETVDAEDMNNLMNALWEQIDRAILGHGGRIDKHLGDGIMAIWGAGTAREDDPEQAVRAALEIQQEVQHWQIAMNAFPLLSWRVDMALRIGIHTGAALLGPVGTTGEYTAIGDTVNTANRLQEVAPKGGILISRTTYQYVADLFRVTPWGSLTLRGKADPIVAYEIRQMRPRSFRVVTREVEGVRTSLVGREAELSLLQEQIQLVLTTQQLCMVTIVGEAGLGKSRLLLELDEWSQSLPGKRFYFKGRARQEMHHTPYALLRNLFAYCFQIQESDQSKVICHKIELGFGAVFGNSQESQQRAFFLGQLLGFDCGRHAALPEDAQQGRDLAFSYLHAYFRRLSAVAPICIFLEDIHWADDSSLDMIAQLAAALPDMPVFLLCLARPALYERRPDWGEHRHTGDGQPFHIRLPLKALSRADGRRLVAEILRHVAALPESLSDLIARRAEGVPFFIEEIIKMLLEDEIVVKGEPHWLVDLSRLENFQIPAKLTGVLQARIDSLPDMERLVLQQASVIGRAFWSGALQQLQAFTSWGGTRPASMHELQQALTALQARELILRQETSAFAGTEEYIFRHAMLHEVAYEGVLKRMRRLYHALVAEWLIGQRVEDDLYSGMIAEHLAKAGDAETAVSYLTQAGVAAAAKYANAEALAYLDQALLLLPPQDETSRYQLLLTREQIYHLRGQRQTQRRDLAALENLAESMNSPYRRTEVALHHAAYALATGDYQGTIIAAQTAIRLTPAAQNPLFEASGYLLWGQALRSQGDYATAQRQFEQALLLVQRGSAPEVRAQRPYQQAEANCLQHLGLVAIDQNNQAQAQAQFELAQRIFSAIGDRRGEGQSWTYLGVAARLQGSYVQAQECLEQALRIHTAIGSRQGEGVALDNLGLIARQQGDHNGAVIYHERFLRISHEIGDRHGEAVAYHHLGEVSARLQDWGLAVSRYQTALQVYEDVGDRRSAAMVQFLLGRAWNTIGDYAEARAALQQAQRAHQVLGSPECICHDLVHQSRALLGLQAYTLAAELAQQGIQLAQQQDEAEAGAYGWLYLGQAQTALARWAEAAVSYQTAREQWQALERPALAMAAQAGLAYVAWSQGKLEQAAADVEQIWHYLKTQPPADTDELVVAYWICYQILQAVADYRALDVLQEGYRLLTQTAARLHDDRYQTMFWENIAAHQALRAAYTQGEVQLLGRS